MTLMPLVKWSAKYCVDNPVVRCKICNREIPSLKAWVDAPIPGDIFCFVDTKFAGSTLAARELPLWDKLKRVGGFDRR